MNTDNTPLVSICCITYNHSAFIRQCLEGFVSQQTSFPFEALIYDDASTDGNADIIREYEKRYPDIIKPVCQTENQYSKGIWVNNVYNISRSKGKYIALCEGDDHWIDPFKLQKQIDFLENNPEYTLCFHDAIVREAGCKDHTLGVEDRDYSGAENIRKWTMPTASLVFRKSILDTELYGKVLDSKNRLFGDMQNILTAAEYGKLRGFSDVMSVYNKHNGGVTVSLFPGVENELFLAYMEIIDIFGKEYSEPVKHRYKGFAVVALANVFHGKKEYIKIFFRVFRFMPREALGDIFRWLPRIAKNKLKGTKNK